MKKILCLLVLMFVSSPAFAGSLSEGLGELCYEIKPVGSHESLESIEGMDILYINGNFAVFQKYGDRKNVISTDRFHRGVHAGYWGEAPYYLRGDGWASAYFLGIHIGFDPQNPGQKPYVKILSDGTVYDLEPVKMLNCQTNF